MTILDYVSIQRRSLRVLATGQVLGGLGMGAAFSLGSLLTAEVGGSPAYAGLSATMSTLGTALFAIPLARLAGRVGRRYALATGGTIGLIGAIMVIVAASANSLPFLLFGMLVLGAGGAVNLQTRFAAADLAKPETRARDLSLVVWATTIGVVAGPNLVGPGDALGETLGLPPLTGAFALAAIAQLFAAILYLTSLRPDPLLVARQRQVSEGAVQAPAKKGFGAALKILAATPVAAVAVFALAMSHATMVAVMAMTPVHLALHGVIIPLIGLTISLHTAGMYAFSPIFGWLADRWGRTTVILLGQAILLASLLVNFSAPDSVPAVTVALVLLGLGWSAATVASSALLTESVEPQDRTTVQGFSDTVMSLAGAGGGALAGLVLAAVGYGLLNIWTISLVVLVVIAVLSLGWRTKHHATA
ncbi:MFS family permease [Aurantimicrobium minutum]|uniref:MFS transporter n=1 Tax=Aurantimicrobium minutum TaxID=708131 RepID=UPI00247549F7|nr:MFS transporter [Aurantimicrobium minutum]MDH6532670.1 MFS family permease [Aurantimicrobium minutum]